MKAIHVSYAGLWSCLIGSGVVASLILGDVARGPDRRTTWCPTPEQRAAVPVETAGLDDLTLIRNSPEPEPMDEELRSLARLVASMRGKQRDYFRTRDRAVMDEARKLERDVDHQVADILTDRGLFERRTSQP